MATGTQHVSMTNTDTSVRATAGASGQLWETWSWVKDTANKAISDLTTVVNELKDLDGTVINTEIKFPVYGDEETEDLPREYINLFNSALSYINGVVLPERPVTDDFDYPARPVIPSIPDIPPISDISIPEFTATAPVLDYGDFPADFQVTLPDAPEISIQTPPDPPTLLVGDAPVYQSPALPEPTGLIFPVPAEIPDMDTIITPTETFSFSETAYVSLLKDPLATKLLNDLLNGGYGIETEDETALWNRARDREAIALSGAVDIVQKQMESLGYSKAPGAMAQAMEKAIQDYKNKIGDMNREIMVKKADLYVQNRQFTIEKAIALESLLMNYHGAMMERALNASRYSIQAAVDLFNLTIAKANYKLAYFEKASQQFKDLMMIESLKIERYKADLAGTELQNDFEKVKIESYRANLAHSELLISLYRGQLEALQVISQVERNKVDVFRAEIEAFGAQVAAKKAEFDAYDSRVRGELGKTQVYATQAQAYATVMEGKRVTVEVEKLKLQSAIDEAKLNLESFSEQVKAYSVDYEVIKSLKAMDEDEYRSAITAYSAKMEALGRAYNLGLQAIEYQYRMVGMLLDKNIESAKSELSKVMEAAKLNAVGVQASGDIYRNVAAAALGAINAHAQVSDSVSSNWSVQESEELAEHYSYNYSYTPIVE